MERVSNRAEVEPEQKKAKISEDENNALENNGQDQKPPEKEEEINSKQNNIVSNPVMPEDVCLKEAVALLDIEGRNMGSVISGNGEDRGEIPLSVIRGRKAASMVASDGVNNNEEVSLLVTEAGKNASTISGDANDNGEVTLLFTGERKDASTASTNVQENGFSTALAPPLTNDSLSRFRKKLLVLDLNGLLADIVCPPPKDFAADINIARRAVFKRPFCNDFLNFCFERFEVGIWSSRTQKNVDRITDFLLGDMKHKLLFSWDVSYCTKTTYSSLENQYKYLVFKELRRLWVKEDASLPWERGVYNQTNTLLLDDSPYKALLNPPHTAIFPNSYNYLDKNDSSLGEGGDVRLYLEMLAAAENVQEFVERNPFGQEPINETSESWEFYSQVLATLRS